MSLPAAGEADIVALGDRAPAVVFDDRLDAEAGEVVGQIVQALLDVVQQREPIGRMEPAAFFFGECAGGGFAGFGVAWPAGLVRTLVGVARGSPWGRCGGERERLLNRKRCAEAGNSIRSFGCRVGRCEAGIGVGLRLLLLLVEL